MRLRQCLAGLVVVFTASVAYAQGNLVVNGSFEEGDFSPVNIDAWVNVPVGENKILGWVVEAPYPTYGDEAVHWHNTRYFSPMQDGSRAVDLSASGICYEYGGGGVSQTIPTTPGNEYRLTFHMTGPWTDLDGCSGVVGRALRVLIADVAEDFTVLRSLNTALQWTRFTKTFVATESSTKLTFVRPPLAFDGYWGPVIDDISVIEAGPTDKDDDGVRDNLDTCAGTAPDSVVDTSGCSIADLCPCMATWKSHGRYVSCVARTSGDFIAAGLITGDQTGSIVSRAARSACGRGKRP